MKDSSGNTYFNVENIRITTLSRTWDNGNPGLRIQAYKDKGDALFQGAELPVPNKEIAYELIKTIIEALEPLFEESTSE